MGSQEAAVNMSLDDIRMNSKDLIDKKEIDSGGFGKVSVCCHRIYGLVALKTVFTGYKNDSYNNDLYEEGKMMYKLNHERIVKLMGVIIEDGNYALVIEYMTKGNLLQVLKQITVPISVKARFILEIIEGMMYLHDQNVIHKDLKPENILADDDFHVKIADLGAAAFQKWSTLTKEETARQRTRSRSEITAKTKNAGTLSYMAPEHLQSLNTRATEKSDVYSFAIVIWVILTNKEPYENAIHSDQISLCVSNGDRPDIEETQQCDLKEASDLMEQCWKNKPEERPSFQDCEKAFRPIYDQKYVQSIEKDVAMIQESYPKPNALIQRMASLQLDCDAEPASIPRDQPLSLHSSLGLQHGHVNVNSFTPYSNEPVECEEERFDNLLERKLQDEKNYHRTGSRIDNVANHSNPPPLSDLRSRKVFSEPNERNSTPVNMPYSSSNEPPAHRFPPPYFQNPDILQPPNRHVDYHQPNEPRSTYIPYPVTWNTLQTTHAFQNLYPPETPVPFDPSKLPVAESGRPNLYTPPVAHTHDSYDGVGRAVGIEASHMFTKGNFGYSQIYSPEKSVNLTISNSSAFQIGNNNYINIGRESDMKSPQGSHPVPCRYAEVFESNSLLNESQMQLLRENLSKKWKEFARKVGFRQPEIEEIDHDYDRDGLKEKVYQMLHKWQMKEGSKNATVRKVAMALYSLKDEDLLNQLIALN